MKQNHQTIPVTLIRGLLESGKTTFLRRFLQDSPPQTPVLVIACEEGMEELEPMVAHRHGERLFHRSYLLRQSV